MDIKVSGNRAQLPKLFLSSKYEISVEGRGTGKSYDIGFKMDYLVRTMPKAIIALTGKTFGQLLTRTLPSSLKLLNRIGYQKDVNYVIGKRPPSYFADSYECINKFDNVISFSNGTRFAMISQSEPGSGRGANVDYEIIDEALLIDREQYNNEVSPTNRGNIEFFGVKSNKPIAEHHGCKFSTSMPINKEGRWILEYADYYYKERGIRIFELWNKIVMLQVELVDIADSYKKETAISERKDLMALFKQKWSDISVLKKAISPFVSKDGILFTLSNAFDNLDMLGIDYLVQNKRKLPYLIFMTEIMNMYYDKVEDCFYSLKENTHIYYTSFNTELIQQHAIGKDFIFGEGEFDSSIYDADCNSSQPLELAFDWGSSISLMIVAQERGWDFAKNTASNHKYLTQINEFFVKPDDSSNVMITELVKKFCDYYASHVCKEVVFCKDKYGDHKNPNIANSRTFNEMAIEELQRNGWSVEVIEHRGMEPPQSDKYLLWGFMLSEEREDLPRFRINGEKCKYTLISMNNAKIKNVGQKMEKDKSSERPTSGVLPEEATHFSDAVDKLVWTKYGGGLRQSGRESFVFF